MRALSELVEAAQSGDSKTYDALIQCFQQMAGLYDRKGANLTKETIQ